MQINCFEVDFFFKIKLYNYLVKSEFKRFRIYRAFQKTIVYIAFFPFAVKLFAVYKRFGFFYIGFGNEEYLPDFCRFKQKFEFKRMNAILTIIVFFIEFFFEPGLNHFSRP